MGMFDNKETRQNTSTGYNDVPQEAPPSASPFDKVGGAKAREGGVYPVPGIYPILYLDSMKMIRSRKDEDLFVAEFLIVDSDVDERPTGTRVSWVCNLTKHEAAPGNVKGFMAALMGISTDEVDSDGAKFACSDKQPCRGRLIRLEASNTITRGGNDFTLCRWHSLPDAVQANAEELLKRAGFAPF